MVTKHGPYRVLGDVAIHDADGNRLLTGPSSDLCRCGGFGTKPLCDTTHCLEGFDEYETADHGPIADRRDSYPAVASSSTTIAAAAHFGQCTRRLPGAFPGRRRAVRGRRRRGGCRDRRRHHRLPVRRPRLRRRRGARARGVVHALDHADHPSGPTACAERSRWSEPTAARTSAASARRCAAVAGRATSRSATARTDAPQHCRVVGVLVLVSIRILSLVEGGLIGAAVLCASSCGSGARSRPMRSQPRAATGRAPARCSRTRMSCCSPRRSQLTDHRYRHTYLLLRKPKLIQLDDPVPAVKAGATFLRLAGTWIGYFSSQGEGTSSDHGDVVAFDLKSSGGSSLRR